MHVMYKHTQLPPHKNTMGFLYKGQLFNDVWGNSLFIPKITWNK